MFGGRIVEVLPPGTPLDDARHPYTQALLAVAARAGWLAGRATADAELAAALPAVGCPFRARCPLASGICERSIPRCAT